MAGTVPVRLLAIDIFGATSIVYSLRIGVVHLRRWHHSKSFYGEYADEPDYYDTAWSHWHFTEPMACDTS